MRQAFSAPGKALFAGGYLVLDPKFSSYVIALSARMHALVSGHSIEGTTTTITATSPQFQGGSWSYTCPINTLDITSSATNPFIEAIVRAVLAYANPQKAHNIEITVYSDDEFHSQKDEVDRKGQFAYHEKAIHEVPKTGLGSSAALTVVVAAALTSYLLGDEIENLPEKVHNLSQLAHCTAQGKIGSGFDVASAVYGSIIYRRFAPTTLGDLTDASKQNFETVPELINRKWDMVARPVALPDQLSLLMGDVKGGSETPKLVSTVLAWKKDQPERSSQVWQQIDSANQSLIELLETYNGDNSKLGEQIEHIRTGMRTMSKESGAPIEPPSQTLLLDAATQLDGVLGGVVPGAGGYDAVSLLVETAKIDAILAATGKNDILKTIKWLNLHQEERGLKNENLNKY